jgi:response regulator RpfG family c-di-GMP phosphodiesterase
MDRLLFVDDEPFVLRALKRTFEMDGFEVITATRPADAVEMLKRGDEFVVIGSDYRMPEMDGAEFLQRARDLCPDTARLLISAVEEFHAAVDSINRAAIYRFVPKPWDRDELRGIVRAAVDEYHRRRLGEQMATVLEGKTKALESLTHTLEERVVERTYDLLEALVAALDQRGAEKVHSRKVTAWSLRLGHQLGLDRVELAVVEQGAIIHDIGKIGIPDSVLRKNGDLTAEEWAQLKRHPELGYRMLAAVPSLERARRIVLQHHERWDGSGYPLGLKGEEIDRGARLLHLAEAYDSITEDRSWRKGRSAHDAREEIVRCSGTQFDPAVVQAFCRVALAEWEAIGRAAARIADQPQPTLEELRAEMLSK